MGGGSMLQEVVPTEEAVAAAEDRDVWADRRTKLLRFADAMPDAFLPPSDEVRSRLAAIGRNFVSSQRPLGTLIAGDRDGVPAVSAGHEKHPSTTHAATSEVFLFLERGVAGSTGTSNDELRATCAAQ